MTNIPSNCRLYMQRILDSKPFLLACMCLCTFTQGMLVNSVVPQSLTTIQKRYHLSSLQAGVFGNAYEVAALIFIIPCTYLGGKGNKIRWLSAGMFIVGLGAALCALPQFISKAYVPPSSESDLCVVDQSTHDSQEIETRDNESFNVVYFLILVGGQFLNGVGATPIYSLGITQLDQCAPENKASLYIGIYLASSIMGPAIGYLGGGASLRIYGDFYRQSLDPLVDDTLKHLKPGDADFYGAWWILFLVCAAMSLTASLLLFFISFRHGQVDHETWAKKVKSKDDMKSGRASNSVRDGKSNFWRDVKDILGRGSFMFLVAVDTLEGLIDTGVVLFFPKLLENFFKVSTSMSSIYTGASVIPSAVLGTLLGAWLINRFQMTAVDMTRMSILLHIGCIFVLPMFLLRCPMPQIVGVNFDPLAYNSTVDKIREYNTSYECNTGCACDQAVWSPVCDVTTGQSFVGPCYAACATQIMNGDEYDYSNCSCAFDKSTTLLPDLCTDECQKIIPFILLFGLYVFLAFTSSIPIQKAELNSFPAHLTSFAFGIRWMFIRILGTIPSPIMFGVLIDASCMYWTHNSQGSTLECPLYNTATLSLIFTIVGVTFKALIVLCLFLSWRKFRRIGDMQVVQYTVNSPTKYSMPQLESPGIWAPTPTL